MVQKVIDDFIKKKRVVLALRLFVVSVVSAPVSFPAFYGCDRIFEAPHDRFREQHYCNEQADAILPRHLR
jgi:predicted nuclease with RNAse H fold